MKSSERRPCEHLRIAALILVLGLVAPGAPHAAPNDARTHLFMLSGQSNMKAVDPRWVVEDAKQSFPGDSILIAKAANFGKPIRYWVESWYELAAANGIDPGPFRERDEGRAGVTYRHLLHEVDSQLAGRSRPDSVTLLWMQGESDTDNGATEIYGKALRRLIQSLKRDLRRPDLNVVIGRLNDAHTGELPGWDAVREMQVRIAGEGPRYAWVDTDDLNDKKRKGVPVDDLHLTMDGYRVFAGRMVLQAAALIRGEEPAADGRPE